MDISPGPAPAWPDTHSTAQARRGNRRRLLVFGVVFALVMAVGQAWNLSRPAEYRTQSRLQIDLPDATGAADRAAESTYVSRLQLINSRPVLARLVEQLRQSGVALPGSGEASVSALQALLEVQPVPGSEVLQVQATGTDPRLLFEALNALPEVVRTELAGRQRSDADERLELARQELSRLEEKALERRAKLQQFRQRAGVVAERDENEAVAANKGLTAALNGAVEKETAAVARLRAVTEAAAQGRLSTSGRQDGTLVALEGKAHQLREEIKEMERTFTPAFMEMDPKARALRVRLTELERQVAQQREASLAAALQAAQEDVSTAQAQVARLREKQAGVQPSLGRVSTRLVDAKVLEDDLAQVEKARRELLERVSRLESNQQRRVARVGVVEAAVLPTAPFRPDRWLDGAWVAGGALLSAALVMLLVEVFNRPPPVAAAAPANTTLVLSPGWPGGSALAGAAPAAALAHDAGVQRAHPALAPPPQWLRQDEAAALLAASRGSARLACALGLLGLSVPEALALNRGDVDSAASTLQVRGAWARQVPLPPWLTATLQHAPPAAPTQPLLCDAAQQPLEGADLQALLVGAALDAGLPQGAALRWDQLRVTCIDWLLGCGLRYSELPQHVGRVDADLLAALARRGADTTTPATGATTPADWLMPALRLDPDGAPANPPQS